MSENRRSYVAPAKSQGLNPVPGAPGNPRAFSGRSRPSPAAKGEPMGMCDCNQSWTALTAAHCAVCHRTFSAVSLFDKHRKVNSGECAIPGGVEFRNGMWRGPEMSEEVKALRRGR